MHAPKAAEEDPHAQRRIHAILASPGDRLVDEDVDFLDESDSRGLRLQLDYFKAQRALERHDVRHTIVVFGAPASRGQARAAARDAVRAAIPGARRS